MAEKTLAELTAWPTKADDMDVDLMLRVIGRDTQIVYLQKWETIDKDKAALAGPLYMAQTQQLIASVGLMACLRALRDANPAKAETFAREYWEMCDAGDSFGEALWEFTEAAGLDPELIKLPPAVDSAAETEAAQS